jgi:ABC-type multidrug transport system fused ATPase/permease subunit
MYSAQKKRRQFWNRPTLLRQPDNGIFNLQLARDSSMLCTEIIEPDSAAFVRGAIALETRKLSRAVVDKVLVNEVSAQVQWGEVLAVVGPSGAGKSSFLRLLNRLDEPTGGTVLVNGQDYHQIAARDLRRRVGMVLQMAYLFPGAVAANIAFGPMQRGESPSQEQIAALLERVGLPGYQDRDTNGLSGGEAQRVTGSNAGKRSRVFVARRAHFGPRRSISPRDRGAFAGHHP